MLCKMKVYFWQIILSMPLLTKQDVGRNGADLAVQPLTSLEQALVLFLYKVQSKLYRFFTFLI